MVVSGDQADESEDTRGQHASQNLRNYTLKSAIFNFAAIWKALKNQTLKWLEKLLNNMDAVLQFKGCEVSGFTEQFGMLAK
jgi:hypothetical protein